MELLLLFALAYYLPYHNFFIMYDLPKDRLAQTVSACHSNDTLVTSQ